MKKKTLLFSLIVVQSIIAFSQQLSVNGENYLLLDGERFKNQKIVFAKADGDWYATNKDGHGTISMYSKFDGRDLRLDLEWDGKKDAYPVTNENRHHVREAEFLITMPDKDVYNDGLNSYPLGEDEVDIKITAVDALTVSGEVHGVVTEDGKKVKVSGVFHLKRQAASKGIVSASYHDCDNVVHDKLIGAEGRSPSDCEAKYDLDVRTTIHDALNNVLETFQNKGWEIEKQTNLEPLTIVGRGSEKDIFSTAYELKLTLGQSSPVYADYAKKFNDYSEKLKDASKEDFDRFVKFSREMNSAISSFIRFSVNNHGMGFSNFKGGSKITKLSANVYEIQGEYVQARTGGGEDASLETTFLVIGNWKTPVIEKFDDGSEHVKAGAVLNPSASHLQAQNIVIRMECNSNLADEIIKNLDLQKLQSLINH